MSAEPTKTPTPRTDAGTCLYCQNPIANDQEWKDIPGGEGEHLCWGECPERDDVDGLLRQARTDLQHLTRVAGEAAQPITMQDVRLRCGEGILSALDVLVSVNIILKQRLSEIERIKQP